MSAPRTKDEQVAEILHAGKDPVYFTNEYVKIQHPKQGLIPCKLYPFQVSTLQAFNEHRFNIVVKARQLGLSTITGAYALWLAMFHKDKNILVIATKLSTALNFIKKVKVALQNLPPWMLLTSYTTTFNSVKFGNRSVITAIPTAEDAGRSEALSLLICDEAAIIRGFEDIWTGLSPTISTGGNAILLSTPYGVGGQFYKMWVDAESGVNGFNPIKLPWDVHPEHDQVWFEKECKRLQNSTKKISQELTCVGGNSGIITKNGFKKAQDIQAGDEVLTHRGRFRKVTHVVGRDVNEDEKLYRARCPGSRQLEILLTGNHPVLTSRYQRTQNSRPVVDVIKDEFESIGSEFISIDDIVAWKDRSTRKVVHHLFPRLSAECVSNSLQTIDVSKLLTCSCVTDETCRYTNQWDDTVRNVEVDFDLGKFIGLFVAEGCNHDSGGIDLAFHTEELNTHIKFIQEFFRKYSVRSSVQLCGGGSCYRIYTSNKFFGEIVRRFVKGRYSYEKVLDMDLVLSTNTEFIRGLITGHFDGDGTHHPEDRLDVVSTSPNLIRQMRMLISMFGHYPRLGVSIPANEKYHVGYRLQFENVKSRTVDKVLLVDKSELDKRVSRTRLVEESQTFIGHVVFKEMSDELKKSTRVFDISVEEDNSFVVESLIVHNCNFVASGDTFLSQDDFDYLQQQVSFPIRKMGEDHGVWVWREPDPCRRYIISADISRGDSGDFSTCHVIDTETVEVVAEYKGKIPPDKMADVMMDLGRKYNTALLCPENNTFGYTTAIRLRDLGYPRLYYASMKSDVFTFKLADRDETPGFNTQAKSRIQVLSKLEEVIRNKVLKIHSSRFNEEIKAFVWHGARAQASKDSNDDLVMSLAIGVWILDTAVGYNADSQFAAKQVLENMQIIRRDTSQTQLGDVNNVRPPMGSMYATPSMNAGANVNSRARRVQNDALDFSWLLK